MAFSRRTIRVAVDTFGTIVAGCCAIRFLLAQTGGRHLA
jgi:hypothetical protein